MRFDTLAVHSVGLDPATRAVAPPIHLSTTFARDEGYELGEWHYVREANPTQALFETALAKVEGGAGALAFASGMAAGVAVLQSLPPGSHVVLPDDLYYGYRIAAIDFLAPWGFRFAFAAMDEPGALAELDQRAAEAGRRLRVLVQVKVGDEPTKSGVLPAEAPALIEGATRLPHLELAGLMAIPPPPASPEGSRRWFARLRELRGGWDGTCCPRGTLRELSMGMSADYEVAIAEGATIVRVGSAIFGFRA